MLIHAGNAVLIYILAKKLLKNNALALFASFFFVSSFAISQSLTWFAATVNTLGSAFFLLGSIILFLDYLENLKKNEGVEKLRS